MHAHTHTHTHTHMHARAHTHRHTHSHTLYYTDSLPATVVSAAPFLSQPRLPIPRKYPGPTGESGRGRIWSIVIEFLVEGLPWGWQACALACKFCASFGFV